VSYILHVDKGYQRYGKGKERKRDEVLKTSLLLSSIPVSSLAFSVVL